MFFNPISYRSAVWLALSALLLPVLLVAQEFSPGWSSFVGSDWDYESSESILAVTTDSRTNLYFAGAVLSAVANDAYIYSTNCSLSGESGGQDGVLGRADKEGNLIWYTILGSEDSDQMAGVAVHDNQLFGVGTFQRYDVIAEGVGSSAVAIALQSSDGSEEWAWSLDEVGSTNGLKAVVCDSAGRLYVAGYVTTTDLDNIVGGNSHQGQQDAVVMRLNPGNGNIIWTRYLGGANNDRALTLAVGTDGRLYVGGETRSPDWAAKMSDNFTPGASNPCGFIASLDGESGALHWATIVGGSVEGVRSLVWSSDNSQLYAGGSTSSSTFLNNKTRLNSHSGSEDGYVISLSDQGSGVAVNWCRFAGSSAADRVTALVPHAGGSLVVGGNTKSGGWLPMVGNSTFGGDQDGFLLVLDSSGTPLWSRYLGGSNKDEINALANLDGSLYLGGATHSATWVGGGWRDTWEKGWGVPEYANSYGLVALYSADPPTPPVIVNQPSNLNLVEGDVANFTVTASGFQPISYRWYRNNVRITGANSNSYSIDPVTTANDGEQYYCLVSNYFGHVESERVLLNVVAKGWLRVNLTPGDAVVQGAQWRVLPDGGWLASGTTTNIAPGSYSVEYSEVAGWMTPHISSAVVVNSSATTTLNIPYSVVLPEASRSISATNVTLEVRAPEGVVEWMLVESLPAALTPQNITGGGVWNSGNHTLTFSGVEAVTNTFSYSVVATTSGAYRVSGTITAQPAGHSVGVSGDTDILRANVVRSIVVAGDIATVTITMYEPRERFTWWVEEFTPVTLAAPYDVNGPGSWDAGDGSIYWSQRGTAMTLSYKMECVPGTHYFSGKCLVVDGPSEPIFGDAVLVYGLPSEPVPPPNILGFDPLPDGTGYLLTFTSVVDQAYMIMTNGSLKSASGWAPWVPVSGSGPTTQQSVPCSEPALFIRVRVVDR